MLGFGDNVNVGIGFFPWGWFMTLGQAERQGDLLDDVNRFCEQMLPESSVFSVLARERDRLFPDDLFADLFSDRGRRSVPPSVVATVMVLQRLEGLSDREAVERYCFDNRWRYACGVGGYDGDGWVSFAHTVLVDMRARVKASKDPRRLFRVVLDAASQAGLVGVKRVLDSTPLYDAVATMDTITLIRSAIRALLRVADQVLEGQLRWLHAQFGGDAGCRVAGDGVGSRPRSDPGPRRAAGGVQGRAAGREGPGHLHRGPASPPWAQELSARVRRLQRAYRD